jgi:hypothetical protein
MSNTTLVASVATTTAIVCLYSIWQGSWIGVAITGLMFISYTYILGSLVAGG